MSFRGLLLCALCYVLIVALTFTLRFRLHLLGSNLIMSIFVSPPSSLSYYSDSSGGFSLYLSQLIGMNGMPLHRYTLVMIVLVYGLQSQLFKLTPFYHPLVSMMLGVWQARQFQWVVRVILWNIYIKVTARS